MKVVVLLSPSNSFEKMFELSINSFVFCKNLLC